MVFIGRLYKVNKKWQIDKIKEKVIIKILEVHQQQALVKLALDNQLDSNNNLQWVANNSKIEQEAMCHQAWSFKTSNNKTFK